jgi:hypothetical protein
VEEDANPYDMWLNTEMSLSRSKITSEMNASESVKRLLEHSRVIRSRLSSVAWASLPFSHGRYLPLARKQSLNDKGCGKPTEGQYTITARDECIVGRVAYNQLQVRNGSQLILSGRGWKLGWRGIGLNDSLGNLHQNQLGFHLAKGASSHAAQQ